MKCNHKEGMFAVEDRTGWVVGYLCDCGYFEHRKGMPSYDERMREYIAREKEMKEWQEGKE